MKNQFKRLLLAVFFSTSVYADTTNNYPDLTKELFGNQNIENKELLSARNKISSLFFLKRNEYAKYNVTIEYSPDKNLAALVAKGISIPAKNNIQEKNNELIQEQSNRIKNGYASISNIEIKASTTNVIIQYESDNEWNKNVAVTTSCNSESTIDIKQTGNLVQINPTGNEKSHLDKYPELKVFFPRLIMPSNCRYSIIRSIKDHDGYKIYYTVNNSPYLFEYILNTNDQSINANQYDIKGDIVRKSQIIYRDSKSETVDWPQRITTVVYNNHGKNIKLKEEWNLISSAIGI